MNADHLHLKLNLGDVVSFIDPNGRRCRYMVTQTVDATGTHYTLSDHCEGSAYYDHLLDERTVLTLQMTRQQTIR